MCLNFKAVVEIGARKPTEFFGADTCANVLLYWFFLTFWSEPELEF